MTKHTRYQHSLEDLFLHVYVWVDNCDLTPLDKRVFRDSEPAFYKHLESLLNAGFSEIEEDNHPYAVKVGRGDDWAPYFVLRPVLADDVSSSKHLS